MDLKLKVFDYLKFDKQFEPKRENVYTQIIRNNRKQDTCII